MYTVVYMYVMQVCNVCVHLEDQMGTQCSYNVPILSGYNALQVSSLTYLLNPSTFPEASGMQVQ